MQRDAASLALGCQNRKARAEPDHEGKRPQSSSRGTWPFPSVDCSRECREGRKAQIESGIKPKHCTTVSSGMDSLGRACASQDPQAQAPGATMPRPGTGDFCSKKAKLPCQLGSVAGRSSAAPSAGISAASARATSFCSLERSTAACAALRPTGPGHAAAPQKSRCLGRLEQAPACKKTQICLGGTRPAS